METIPSIRPIPERTSSIRLFVNKHLVPRATELQYSTHYSRYHHTKHMELQGRCLKNKPAGATTDREPAPKGASFGRRFPVSVGDSDGVER